MGEGEGEELYHVDEETIVPLQIKGDDDELKMKNMIGYKKIWVFHMHNWFHLLEIGR